MLESWINIHALFGLLLCTLVLMRYEWQVQKSVNMEMTDIREASRHLSRIVYLLLYVVIGVRQLIAIAGSRWHGGALDFISFDEGSRGGPDHGVFNPKDDFQLFFISGIFALVFARILAAGLGDRLAKGTTPSTVTSGLPSGHFGE